MHFYCNSISGNAKTKKQKKFQYAANDGTQDTKSIKQTSYNLIIINLSIHILNDLVDVIDFTSDTHNNKYGISRLLVFCPT